MRKTYSILCTSTLLACALAAACSEGTNSDGSGGNLAGMAGSQAGTSSGRHKFPSDGAGGALATTTNLVGTAGRLSLSIAGSRNVGFAGAAGAAGADGSAGRAGMSGQASVAGATSVHAPFFRLTATASDKTLRATLAHATGAYDTVTVSTTVTINREGSQDGSVLVSTDAPPAPGVGIGSVTVPGGTSTVELPIVVQTTAMVGGPYTFNVVVSSSDEPSMSTKIPMELYIAGPAGSLDVGFGTAGVARIKVAPPASEDLPGVDSLSDVAVDDKGRVIVGGATDSRGWVARFSSNGTPDSQFGTNSRQFSFGLPKSWVDHVSVSSGQLYVAARIQGSDGSSTYYLRKLAESGSTDTTFNNALDVVLQGAANEMIPYRGGVLAAVSGSPILYSASGQVDPSFAAPSGVTTQALGVDPVGRVVYATRAANNIELQVGRLLTSGAPDPTFIGTTGIVTVPCPTDDVHKGYAGVVPAIVSVHPMVVAPEEYETIVLSNCGGSERESYYWESALVARTVTGYAATWFGSNPSGRLVARYPSRGLGAIAQTDDKIVVLLAKYSRENDTSPITYTYAVSRYDASGKLDQTFANAGSFDLSGVLNEEGSLVLKMAYESKAQRLVVVSRAPSTGGLKIARIWL